MNNLQKALKEMDEEWFASLPEVDEAPPFETSEAFKEWEQRVIYGQKMMVEIVCRKCFRRFNWFFI